MQPTHATNQGDAKGVSSVKITTNANSEEMTAAQALVEHLFADNDSQIPGIDYAVRYRLAEEFVGGDIVDVYHFDNNSVAFSIADISGKGLRAAVHTALVKFGLRALTSHGLTPEGALKSLDRLYLENNAFEGQDSFCTVFYALVAANRKVLTYANAGHEPAFLVHADGSVDLLNPTAPLIGVFDDQHHLFRQDVAVLSPGTLFIGATDGITETRDETGEQFGLGRLMDLVRQYRNEALPALVDRVIEQARNFGAGRVQDDMAIIAVRFLELPHDSELSTKKL